VDSLAADGDLDSAAAILKDLAAGCEQSSDTSCASVLFDLGMVRFNSRQMTGADSAWREALAIYEQQLPDYHPAVLDCLRWLSTSALVRGDYVTAEPLLIRIESQWDGGEEPDPDYAVRAAILLGVLYMNQMRFDDAEAAYEHALKLLDSYSGQVTPRLAATLRNNLSNLYRHQGRHGEAEPLLLDQVEALEADTAEAGEMLMAAYHNLGELYSDRRDFDRAEDFFRRALGRNREVHGDSDLTVAFNLTSLGNMYMRADRFEDAATCYEEALSIKRASVGLADRSVANTLVMYSHCCRTLEDWDRAFQLATESFDIRHRNFVSNSWALAEDKALTYADIMRRSADACLSALVGHPTPSEEQLSQATDIVLRAKGQVSEAVFERRRNLAETDDSLATRFMEDYRRIARRIAGAYLDGPSPGDPDSHRHILDSLQALASDLEAKLAQANPRFADVLQMREVTWQEVQEALPNETVLIEYYQYRHRDEIADTTDERYIALIMSEDTSPEVRDIGSADAIESALARVRSATAEMAGWWPGLPEDTREIEIQARRRLSRLLLDPVSDCLHEDRLLLISPDAALNLLSFAALEPEDGIYLAERHPVHYLSAARDLLRLDSEAAPGRGLLAVGDVDYNAAAARNGETGPVDSNGGEEAISALRSTGDLRGNLSPLPYTRREIDAISEQWRSNYDDEVVLCLGQKATESAFRRYAGGRRAIHCATHGYFETTDDSLTGSTASDAVNPLLRSGLWLAGANSSADGAETAEDGCLTAWEVLTLDLSGVEWVVLSACESGLGETKAGEGVYGLRRAFQMAGAQTVISSLWPVPDKATSRFMSALYSRTERSLPRRLQEVCLSELKRLREAGLPDDPVGWAPFIATGDWRLAR
jgi:CHAT domain-containing protein/tetratricopeptide (TPR) repeat protein